MPPWGTDSLDSKLCPFLLRSMPLQHHLMFPHPSNSSPSFLRPLLSRSPWCCQLTIPNPPLAQDKSHTDVGKAGVEKANGTIILPQQGAGCFTQGQEEKERKEGPIKRVWNNPTEIWKGCAWVRFLSRKTLGKKKNRERNVQEGGRYKNKAEGNE